MKLLKLSAKQIMEHWLYVKECITLALPPYVTENVDNILRIQEQLLIGSLECWACVRDDTGEFYGIVTTQIVADEATQPGCKRNILIFWL